MNELDICRVIPLSIDVEDWDKYFGYMYYEYRDIWIDNSAFDDDTFLDAKELSALFNLSDEYKEAKRMLENGYIDYIALRCDID